MPGLVFDYEGLCERVAGRVEIVHELIQMLLSSYPNDRRELEERARARDLSGLQDAAHRLKGQLRTLGIERAANEAQQIETLARGGDGEAASVALADLDREMVEFQQFVQQLGIGQEKLQ